MTRYARRQPQLHAVAALPTVAGAHLHIYMGGSASTAAKALTVAVNADDAAAIRHAVASPAELNKAIHLASRLGKPAALEELLLKDGININHVAADKMGVPASPILVAIQNRQLKCIVLLLADSRTNLSSTQDKPFRKKGVQEPQFKYDRLKERNEYREGIPLLVQAAKMTSPGSSYHHPDYKEIDPIVLALLLDERRVTVNANISRTALRHCADNPLCIDVLKRNFERTDLTERDVEEAKDYGEWKSRAAAAVGMTVNF